MDMRIPLWMQCIKHKAILTRSQGYRRYYINISQSLPKVPQLQSLKGHCHIKVRHQIFFLNALLIDVCRDYADGGRVCLSGAGVEMSAPRPMLDRWRILWRSYGYTGLKAALSQIVNILSNHNKWQGIVNKRDTLNKLRHSFYFPGHLLFKCFKVSINYQRM